MAEEIEPQESAADEVIHDDPAPVETGDDQGSDASEEISPESLASELGWCPKEDWRGNPEEWKPAPDFLKSTVDINKSLRKDLKATREASERAARAAAAITERAVEQERQRLMAARHEAIEMADADTAYRAEQALMQLPQPQRQAPPEETTDFLSRNGKWYGVDPIASQIAYGICEAHARMGHDHATQLAAAEKEVRKRFPEYFADTRKAPPASETTGSRAAGHVRKGPKGFNDLPADAKAAALDFEKRGRASKDEYAQLYWQENA